MCWRLPADLRSQVAALQVGASSCSCYGSQHEHLVCLSDCINPATQQQQQLHDQSEQGLAAEDAQQLRRLPADVRSQVAALQVSFTSC